MELFSKTQSHSADTHSMQFIHGLEAIEHVAALDEGEDGELKQFWPRKFDL